ncbi:MAG: adenosylcobinamide-GDP ribazoletransferase [Acidimicrobiales bacterium]
MGDRTPGGLGSALGLLTVVGGGGEMRVGAVAWFPVVGAALGSGLGAAWWALGRVFPPLVAGGLVVAADLAVTGMLHADGLIDTADGLLPHLDRPRRLAVMAEPQVGAFGVTAAVVVLGLRLAALGSATPASALKGVLLLGAIWMASRSVMGLAARHLRYARDAGMATAFTSSRSVVPALGLVAAGVALVYWHAVAAPAVLGAELLGAGLVLWLAHRRLGGFTGDVLGAAGLVGETLALLVAAAKW